MSLKRIAKALSVTLLGPFGYDLHLVKRRPLTAPSAVALDPPYPVTPGMLTDDLLKKNQAAAAEQNVPSTIHPKDYLYHFCLTYQGQTRSKVNEGVEHYFRDGANSATKLTELLDSLGYQNGRPVKLLEFAAGYGCVTRHLKKYQHLDITSCDIHPEALEFLSNEFGVRTIRSAHKPEQFAPPEQYDVVFALSFFSHMPRSTFAAWVGALFQAVRSPGYLIFTTHARQLLEALGLDRNALDDGFRFTHDSEQIDLDTGEYGTAIALPDFVIPQLYEQIQAPIAMYREAYWWRSQDLWVVRR